MIFIRFCSHPSNHDAEFRWQSRGHGRMLKVARYALVSSSGREFVTALSKNQAEEAESGKPLPEVKPVHGEFEPWPRDHAEHSWSSRDFDDSWGCRD